MLTVASHETVLLWIESPFLPGKCWVCLFRAQGTETHLNMWSTLPKHGHDRNLNMGWNNLNVYTQPKHPGRGHHHQWWNTSTKFQVQKGFSQYFSTDTSKREEEILDKVWWYFLKHRYKKQKEKQSYAVEQKKMLMWSQRKSTTWGQFLLMNMFSFLVLVMLLSKETWMF